VMAKQYKENVGPWTEYLKILQQWTSIYK
jgi:hypothetical protein